MGRLVARFRHSPPVKILSSCALILCGFLLQGCAPLTQENTENFRKDNQEHLRSLRPGMTKDVVLATMGTAPISRCLQSTGGICTDFETINNPYKKSYIEVGRSRYEVLYYYTDDQKRDLKNYYQELKTKEKQVSDDQLTPVLLENGKFVGWGKDVVDQTLKGATQLAK
jgi:hypothetical protein